MADLARIRVSWSGTSVEGPSISTFYFEGTTVPVAAVFSFFDSLKAQIAPGTTLTIPQAGDVLESTTGQITKGWTGTGGGQITTTSTGAFVRGSGARVVWETGGVRNGRHVRGSTFLVPLVAAAYNTAGNIGAGNQTAILNAANALLTAAAGKMVVWSRPKRGSVASGLVAIASAVVPPNPTQLRSRRV